MKYAFILVTSFLFVAALQAQLEVSQLTGAWSADSLTDNVTMLIQDDYCAISSYNKEAQKFNYTYGGVVAVRNNQLNLTIEFHSSSKEPVGGTIASQAIIKENTLTTNFQGKKQTWTRVDKGAGNLAGCWRITGRMENGTMHPMKQGPRKTLKILSASRFQWFAINTETKEFFGTGGGTYTFGNGNYTEQIEFFSRDNSRVGQSLSFNASLNQGVWNHSGLSSKGDSINENWARISNLNR